MFDRQTIQEKFVDIYMEQRQPVPTDGEDDGSKIESLGTLKGYSTLSQQPMTRIPCTV